MPENTQDNWIYQGDVCLAHGGTYFDVSAWRWGYVPAVRITDLGSGCGFRGAVLIEAITINVGKEWSKEKKRTKAALSLYGWTRPQGQGIGRKLSLAEAYMDYGYYAADIDRPAEILQLENDAPLTFDGLTAQRFNGDLEQYIKDKYLA
jgi:hypothetical protein